MLPCRGFRVPPLAWTLLLLCVVATNATQALAQAVGRVLDIQPGARQNGLGAAGVALFGDPSDALWWNPAALGFADRTSTQFTYAELLPGLADIPYRNVAVAAPLASFGGLGTSFTRLDYGGESDESSPSIALGIRLHPLASIGATLKWVSIHYGGIASGEALTSDIGVLLRVEQQPWKFGFGAMYQNAGGTVDFSGGFGSHPLSRNYKVGASVAVPLRLSSELVAGGTALVDYNHSDITDASHTWSGGPTDAFHTWNGGLEGHLTYENIVRVAARCGYYYDPLGNIQDFTFGAGIRAWMVTFDAGWIPQARDSGLDRVLKITAGIHADLSGQRPRWSMD